MRKKVGLPQKGGKLYSSLDEVKYNKEGFAIDENGQIERDLISLSEIDKNDIFLLRGVLYKLTSLKEWIQTCKNAFNAEIVPHTGDEMTSDEKQSINPVIITPPYIDLRLIDNAYFYLPIDLKKGHLIVIHDASLGFSNVMVLDRDAKAHVAIFGLYLVNMNALQGSSSKYYPAVSIKKFRNPENPLVVGGKKKRVVKKK